MSFNFIIIFVAELCYKIINRLNIVNVDVKKILLSRKHINKFFAEQLDDHLASFSRWCIDVHNLVFYILLRLLVLLREYEVLID